MKKLRLKDKVLIISGSHKGKSGVIKEIDHIKSRIKLDGINVKKKHIKSRGLNNPGRVEASESWIHASNVAPTVSGNKPSRVGFSIKGDGKKTRITTKDKKELK